MKYIITKKIEAKNLIEAIQHEQKADIVEVSEELPEKSPAGY